MKLPTIRQPWVDRIGLADLRRNGSRAEANYTVGRSLDVYDATTGCVVYSTPADDGRAMDRAIAFARRYRFAIAKIHVFGQNGEAIA